MPEPPIIPPGQGGEPPGQEKKGIMAIQSGASEGIEVTTAAMDETLGAQTQANGVDEIIVSDVIGTAGNGNITGPTGYVGRLCILRQGQGDEETRLITGETAGTGNTRILVVAEPWVSIPVITTDTIHVSYSSDDMEAFTGMTLNSKTGVYEGGSTREWQIGLGTNFAYVAVFDYQGWEITDRGSTEPGVTVRNNGRLDFGYIQGGSAIQGAIVTSTNNADGEPQIEIEAGGILRAYATIFRSWLNLVSFLLVATADVVTIDAVIKNYTEELSLLVGNHTNLTIAGSGTSTELVRLAAETIINGLVLAGTAGLTTEASDTSTETLTVRGASFLSNLTNITIEANKTWNIVNPVWTIDEASQDDLEFSNATANEVNEKYSFDPVVQDAAGVKISGARAFVYEGLRLDDLVQELTTDSDGLAPGSWVFKNFVDDGGGGLTVLTDGDHAIRIDNYGDFPFVAAQVSSAKFEGAVVLNPDPAIAQANQATAISAGSGITFNTDTNPSEIFDFTTGVNTLGVGETLTFSPSGATGIVTEIASGDSVAGTVHLSDRNATAIANGDTIASSATWTGTYTNDTTQPFSRWVDGNSLSMQNIHDYFAARTAQDSGGFTAEAEVIHEWGKENEPRVLQLGVDGWFTNRSDGEGVFISDRGAGDIDFFTDDDGNTFVPPVSISLTYTGLRDNTEVRVYEEGTTIELVGIENATDGSSDDRSVTFALSASTLVDVRFAHGTAADGNHYIVPDRNSILAFTWPSANTSIPITQVLDRSFDNPA